jgi:excisionase family DNA binding protein
MTTEEAAQELRVSISTIIRYAKAGHIRAAQLPGGSWRLAREDVETLLDPDKAAS